MLEHPVQVVPVVWGRLILLPMFRLLALEVVVVVSTLYLQTQQARAVQAVVVQEAQVRPPRLQVLRTQVAVAVAVDQTTPRVLHQPPEVLEVPV